MNFMKEIEKFTSKVTGRVSEQAKASAISTLKDPEFKASVNQFTRDWLEEHKVVLIAVVGSFLILSILALSNILSNFNARR